VRIRLVDERNNKSGDFAAGGVKGRRVHRHQQKVPLGVQRHRQKAATSTHISTEWRAVERRRQRTSLLTNIRA
jgi:hypothetical protein